jgi:hypothetical protein
MLLKRYVLSVAAVLSLAFGAAGGALAGKGHPDTGRPGPGHSHGHRPTSLIPVLAPRPHAWLKALRQLTHNPTTPRHAKPAHHPKPAHHAKPARPARPKQERQPEPAQGRSTTLSIYEHSTKLSVLTEQGCSAAQRDESGVVVLDFGKPAFKRHGYGTILFSGRFALNHKITAAMLGYAGGYVSCLPKGSTASIALARGTSNYHPDVPSAYEAGVHWARATNKFGRALRASRLAAHVEAAAADDAEPAWDPHFRKTRQFFHGFRAAVHRHTLYDYGSLDGGVGEIWTARQAWYVAGGIRHTKALPEIYNSDMAQQWAELARIARGRYHKGVRFAGVMTQGTPDCDCGLRPSAARRVLASALDAQGVDHVDLPSGGTNIIG